jgi:hypothetical protein
MLVTGVRGGLRGGCARRASRRRAELLAEVARLFEDASEGEPDEPLARQAGGVVP